MTHHSLNPTDTTAPKIAIIGGGLTGLFTATLLERAFSQGNDKTLIPNITIFEKSRSVGRLATRIVPTVKRVKTGNGRLAHSFLRLKQPAFSSSLRLG